MGEADPTRCRDIQGFLELANRPSKYGTRNSLTFVNTTAIAYGQKPGRSLKVLVYAIAVVFTNVRELRVEINLVLRVWLLLRN